MASTANLEKSTVKRLQQLISINIDSARGFDHAAKDVKNQKLKETFQEIGADRRKFAEELQQHVEWTGEEPEHGGSAIGSVHRWWLDLRSKLTDKNAEAVLKEAERGEDAIKHLYEEVIKDTTGSPVNDVLHRQYRAVKSGHDTVKRLRDALKSA